MNKIIFKIILIQFIGCVFFIKGIQKLYLVIQNEKYNCFLESFDNPNCECLDRLHLSENLAIFIGDCYAWFFYSFIFGMILIGLINRIKKRHYLNTILLFVLLYLLFLIRFFRNGEVNLVFNQIGLLFTKDIGAQNLIGGIVYTLIGSLIFWKSYRME